MPVLQAIHRRVALAVVMVNPWRSALGHTFVSVCALYLAHEGAVVSAVFVLIWSALVDVGYGAGRNIAHLHEGIERERALNDALRQHEYTLKELEFARNELLRVAEADPVCRPCGGTGCVLEDQGDGECWYTCLMCGGE